MYVCMVLATLTQPHSDDQISRMEDQPANLALFVCCAALIPQLMQSSNASVPFQINLLE